MSNVSQLNLGQVNGSSICEHGSGLIISIENNVELYETGSGLAISVLQSVADHASGQCISIVQRVSSPTASTFYTRNGWTCYLYIDGRQIPASQIHGDITITRTENDAAQMTFGLIPPRGSLDITAYEGLSVILNVQTAAGVFRAYTGKINTPTLNLLDRKIYISCTDNRRELINQDYSFLVDNIGYYTESVFGVAKDRAQELDYRLSTVPYTLNFNAYGVPQYSYAFAAAAADYSYTDSDIYRDSGRDPQVVLNPRANVINTVNINLEYRYKRLYMAYSTYTWSTDIDCDFLTKGYSLTKRSLIEAAANAAGWSIVGDITFATNFRAGYYNCGGVTTGFSWIETGYTNVAKTENYRASDGTIQTRNVVDANGQQVYSSVPTSYIDRSKEYCDAAQWSSSYRWVQNVIESYTLSITAPQSVTRFGTVSQDESTAVDSKLSTAAWEDNKQYLLSPGYGVGSAVTNSSSSYYNEILNLSDYQTSALAIINKAKTTILKSHRNNYVSFNMFLNPVIDLRHTVDINATSHEGTSIHAKGKVYQIEHTLSPSDGGCNTKITLALSVTDGSASTSSFVIPTRPSNNLLPPAYGSFLSNHYGEDPTDHPEWTGFIGNKFVTVPTVGGTNTYKTQYPESFVVDTPEIIEAYTSNLTLPASQSYTVAIVDDTLEIVL